MKKIRKRAKRPNQKGFSLVEVLMAVVILGLIAAPVCQMLMTSYQVNRKSSRLMTASDIAQTTMESICALCWEDTSTLGGTDIKGVRTYYKNLSGTKPLYPNKISDNTVPIVYGTYAGKEYPSGSDETNANQVTYYFTDVKFCEVGDDGEGNAILVESPAQNGEKPFQVAVHFTMSDWGDKINSPSKAFYTVDVEIVVYDNQGDVFVKDNKIHAMESAIVSKFRDDR